MSPVVFREHETPAGFPIQAVHNPGTNPASDTAEVFDVMQQGIDKGTFMNACTRMNHDARGLINNQKVFVFEKYLERNIFGLKLNRLRSGLADHDQISASHLLTGATGFPIEGYMTRLDQGLDPATREG